MTPEFDIISRYFNKHVRETDLGIGDDAALLTIEPGHQLAISADMLVSGTHFFTDADPYHIGWKSLAVNISDMAAMGAEGKWATLSLALPQIDELWLSAFSRGFFDCAGTFGISLIGGDTTRGPLNISIQIMGTVPSNKAISRAGAKAGDDIWISGSLGTAALALAGLQGRYPLSREEISLCSSALHFPQPRAALGVHLRELASSAIDLSDGLLADLGHILLASNVGAEVSISNIPCTDTVQKYLTDNHVQRMVLAGGDDYELCFTSPIRNRQSILNLSQSLGVQLSVIGTINNTDALIVHGLDGLNINIEAHGFDHFAQG